jgi:16S rRNA processing protein RimM
VAEESTIRYGVLTGPHGLKGGIRCRKDVVSDVTLEVPVDASVGFARSFVSPVRVERVESARDRHEVLFLKGCDDVEAAREYSDKALFVEQRSLVVREPLADPGLIGATVVNEEGNACGTIVGFIETRGHYVWRIEKDENGEQREWMLPAVDEFVLDIDTVHRTVKVRLIPGLYDDDVVEVPSGE